MNDKNIKIDREFDLGYQAYQNKRYKEVIKHFSRVIKLDNNNSAAYNNRGLAKENLQLYEEAIEDYNKAIELDNNNSMIYNNRGVSKYGLQRYEEAIEDFNKAIELDNNYSIAYNSRGVAKSELQRYEEAIEDFNKAIELDNNYSNAYYNRGNSKCDLQQYEEAIEDYNKAVELDNNNSMIYLYYFLHCINFGQYIKGSIIPHIYFRDYKKEKIPLPPLAIQKQIAEKLDYLFDKIDKALTFLKENKEYIKKYRLSILKYAFEGKLTPSSKNWETKTLGEVCEITMGQSPNGKSIINVNKNINSKALEFHQGKIYFSDKYILQSNVVTTDVKKIAKKNSVLLCVRAPVGIINITQREIAIGRGLCALNSKFSNNDFLYFYLLTQKNYFNEKSAGSTFSAITLDIIKNTKIPIPNIEIQKEIVSILDKKFKAMDEIERLNNENIENLLLLKKSLLKEAFSGKLI